MANVNGWLWTCQLCCIYSVFFGLALSICLVLCTSMYILQQHRIMHMNVCVYICSSRVSCSKCALFCVEELPGCCLAVCTWKLSCIIPAPDWCNASLRGKIRKLQVNKSPIDLCVSKWHVQSPFWWLYIYIYSIYFRGQIINLGA